MDRRLLSLAGLSERITLPLSSFILSGRLRKVHARHAWTVCGLAHVSFGQSDVPVQRHLRCFGLRPSSRPLPSGALGHLGYHASRSSAPETLPREGSCQVALQDLKFPSQKVIRLLALAQGCTRHHRKCVSYVGADYTSVTEIVSCGVRPRQTSLIVRALPARRGCDSLRRVRVGPVGDIVGCKLCPRHGRNMARGQLKQSVVHSARKR